MLCVRCKVRYGAVHKIGEGLLCPVCHAAPPEVHAALCFRGRENDAGELSSSKRVRQVEIPYITGRILDDFMALIPGPADGCGIFLEILYADGSKETVRRVRRGGRVVTSRSGRS